MRRFRRMPPACGDLALDVVVWPLRAYSTTYVQFVHLGGA
jgi:hypothetical protein